MQDFSGKLAVVTGGGTGIGRALVSQLAAEGCSVAMCDISSADMKESIALAMEGAPQGVKVTGFEADVAMEERMLAFRDDTLAQHETDHVHLLFNNAGIGGGGSFVTGDRGQWERTFAVCWYGVYYGCRAFVPAMVKANEAHIVNVSSVNGFWASLGPETPHTAYSAAKFAVKGFTEALITDLALNAPHVKASVVMPGHIGTSIALNTLREHGVGGIPENEGVSTLERAEQFKRDGLDPIQAAQIILDGVKAERWRILVGPDAEVLDRVVRGAPEAAYSQDFWVNHIAPAFAGIEAAVKPD